MSELVFNLMGKTKITTLHTEAGSSINNKTAGWGDSYPLTDYNKCIGCTLCSKLCPEACIKMTPTKAGLKPVTDLNFCKGCTLCANECPVKAIAMKKKPIN